MLYYLVGRFSINKTYASVNPNPLYVHHVTNNPSKVRVKFVLATCQTAGFK